MRSKWFAGLSAELRRALIDGATIRSFPRGAWIYVQGDPPRGLWAVVEGEISFSKVGAGGHEVGYHVAGPGFWFGVFGVISGLPLNLAVTAVTEAKLLFVPRKAVQVILDREPRYALQLLRLPFSRAPELLDLVEQITRPNPRSRVASRLLMLQRLASEHADGPLALELRVSQAQLASLAALSRQSVSRVLGEFHAGGAIDIGFRRIVITDIEKLRLWSEELDQRVPLSPRSGAGRDP